MKILSQGKEYIAVHKPSGLMVYSDQKENENLSAQLQLEKQIKRKVFPVHRIDKDTCGVLVYALSGAMAQELTKLFRTRVVRKQYLAIVHGKTPPKATIDSPLQKHKEKVMEAAITDFVTIASAEIELGGELRSYSLVRVDPKTGRFHQIRRHLKSMGHPIVGDPEYGNQWNNDRFQESFGVKRTLLSAVLLFFPDRTAQKMQRVETKPDPDFQRVLKALKLEQSHPR